jgi:uncharacterized membrane protein
MNSERQLTSLRLPLALCAATLLLLSLALATLPTTHGSLWWVGLLSLCLGAGVHRHYQSRDAVLSRSVHGALLLAGGILCLGLGTALLNALQLSSISSAELSQRAQGLIHALIVLVYANLIPKVQASACAQQHLRFAGWVLVLAALVYALAWLLAPLELAWLISTTALASAFSLVVLRWALATSRGARP